MASSNAEQVQRAVLALCPEFARHGSDSLGEPAPARNDRTLCRHFMSCLLSSQVPYELAWAAALEIEGSGILSDAAPDCLIDALRRVLATPLCVNGRMRRYRFYNTKADQLARCWTVFQSEGGLRSLIDGFGLDQDARAWLVRCAPGLGPKQASMFLRDIGFSHDLAVLDRHILDYMALVGLSQAATRNVSGMSHYLKLEDRLRIHASGLGYSLGDFDRAVWVVMRVRSDVAHGCQA